MLKLTTPIKTVLDPEFLASTDSFTERIIGNYMQIGTELTEVDLLHVMTEPPEIFVMDGGMTSLFNSTNVENTQIQKTKIINNLINRILVSADGHLSYQDNVYITNILHKLGIKDEKTFMKEVQRLTTETKEQHETVKLYWEHLDELKELVNEFKEENETTINNQISELTKPVLYLHEEVNSRLQTAAIYHIMKSFFDYSESKRSITNESFRITEQGRLSREMLLERLREEVRSEPAYLTYRHENYYEGDEITDNQVTIDEVSSRVTSAVLLNVIDNIYENVYDRIDHTVNNWLSTEATYFGAAENTLYRIEQNTGYLQYLYEQSVNTYMNQSEYKEEIDILNKLIDISNSIDVRLQQSLGGNTYNNDSYYENQSGDVIENIYKTDIEKADITFNDNSEITEENTTEIINKDKFTEDVRKIYQQSIVRNQQYMRNLKNIIESDKQAPSEKNVIERIQRESRLSLTNPEEFKRGYYEAQRQAKEHIERIHEKTEQLLSPVQQYAHNLIFHYLMAPERFYNTDIISADNMGLLLRDINEVEQASKGQNDGRVKEALKEKEGATPTTKRIENTEIINEDRRLFNSANIIFDTTEHIEREFKDIHERYLNADAEAVVLNNEKNVFANITDRVIERWSERRERPYGPEVSYEDIKSSMVHRSKENILNEEVIENIKEQISNLEQTNKTTIETLVNQEKENRTKVVSVTNDVVEENKEAITRIVNTSVRRQLDEISDKVYNKIERQLKNERQRRGM